MSEESTSYSHSESAPRHYEPSYSHSERSEESQNSVILRGSEKSHLHNNILASPHTKGSVIPQGQYDNTLLASLPTPPPHGWEKISLNNQKYLILNPSKKEISNIDENILVSFVEMASVSDSGFIQNKVDKSIKELKKGGYTYFKENDILIAKITPCMENGKCAIAKNLTNGLGLGSTEFHIFRAKEGLNNKFLFLYLNQDFIRIEAAKNMTGASGHRRVPISFYENIQIPLPPLPMQEKIVAVIESIESKIAILSQNLSLLEDTKAENLQKYL